MQIPLIDLAPWFTGDEAARKAIAEEVDRHLQALGFLVVINHGIDQSVFDDARNAIREFKALPLDVKEKYRQTGEGYRGWVGVGEESNAGAYGVDAPPDLKETYAVGTPVVPDELRARAPRWFAPNIYPDAEVPSFRPATNRFIDEARNLVDELLDLLSLALGMPQDTMRSFCTTPSLSASFNWYLPRTALQAAPLPGQYRIGPHTDYGTLTILDRQPGSGGLEVLADGEWITAPWVEGGLTVNTGLLMGRWSNDRWSPNVHRVAPPPEDDPDEELISLVLFHDPDFDAIIAPLEGCCSADNPPRYEPVDAGEHLARMMDALSVESP